MEKLIITCCTNDPLFFKDEADLNMPVTAREVADAAREACDAGAAVVHVHEPLDGNLQGYMGYNIEAWIEVARLIRQQSDVIFEHGLGGHPYIYCEHYIPPVPPELRQKEYDIRAEKPDMLVVLLAHIHHPIAHDAAKGLYVMPTREDLQRWMNLCRDNGVKPSFESWQIGDYYNLQWLADMGLVDRPYWLTLFLGSECDVGSEATIEELLYRLKNLPEGALWQLSVQVGNRGVPTTEQQLTMLAHAMALGGHVRVGMEDNPYYRDGVPAQSNAQLVERIVRIARDIGREVATPDEARQILGLPRRAA